MNLNNPVAFFDSGVGGLVAVREFSKILPSENILYFADSKNMPYGNKSYDVIAELSCKVLHFLKRFEPKIVVVACGTIGSVLGKFGLMSEMGVFPLIGVIEPSCVAALGFTKNKRVGVMATNATIKTNSYRICLEKLDPAVDVFEVSCPELAQLIEKKMLISNNVLDEINFLTVNDKKTVDKYLNFFYNKGVDTLILGCTHYPLIKDYVANFFCGDVNIISSSYEVACEAAGLLKKNCLAAERHNCFGSFCCYSTDSADVFSRKVRAVLDTSLFSDFYVDEVIL